MIKIHHLHSVACIFPISFFPTWYLPITGMLPICCISVFTCSTVCIYLTFYLSQSFWLYLFSCLSLICLFICLQFSTSLRAFFSLSLSPSLSPSPHFSFFTSFSFWNPSCFAHYLHFLIFISDSGRLLQKAYATQLIKDLKPAILADPNYNAKKFVSLTAIIS